MREGEEEESDTMRDPTLTNLPAHRHRLLAEAGAILACVIAPVAAPTVSTIPLIDFDLACVGTCIVRFAAPFVPHTSRGESSLSQTRRFRGIAARVVTWDRRCHLEQKLYPAMPHHRWRELTVRLDPYLDLAGVLAAGLYRGKP